MQIETIMHGTLRLDGGAMFGVVPRPLWSRDRPTDERNRCTWALRSLLIESGDRLMLVDTGMGDKQSEKFFQHYVPEFFDLDASLAALGYGRNDITDVFLTHLHFDHCGGAIKRGGANGDLLVPAFDRATFWSTERHWDWAVEPNPREQASFLQENIRPLEESGQLKFVERNLDADGNPADRALGAIEGFPGLDILFVDGHTESQMLPLLDVGGRKLLYMADLLPSTTHIPLPWVMGYDTRPLLTIDEKARVLAEAAAGDYTLVLEHDHLHEAAKVKMTDRGVRLDRTGELKDWGW
jgi:glyoxylase-like metal-dependent hydrolase (beta-lactamase superfamily II)